MCKMDKDGYTLKSGTSIPLDNTDMPNFKKEDLMEMFETPLNLYDGMLILKKVSKIGKDVQKISDMLIENMEQLNAHSQRCPIEPTKIESIVNAKIKNHWSSPEVSADLERKWVEILNTKIITSGNIAKAITAIFLLFGLIFTVVKVARM